MEEAITTLDRAEQAAKWQALNKTAVEQGFIIPNVFGYAQNIAGTKVSAVDGLYKWPAYGSWPYGSGVRDSVVRHPRHRSLEPTGEAGIAASPVASPVERGGQFRWPDIWSVDSR